MRLNFSYLKSFWLKIRSYPVIISGNIMRSAVPLFLLSSLSRRAEPKPGSGEEVPGLLIRLGIFGLVKEIKVDL